jgi:hypothetical protein
VVLLLLLIGAPAAALAHALIAWLPTTVVVVRLQRQTARDVAEAEAQWRECHRIQQEMTRLRTIAVEHQEQTAPPCLPERQSHTVCEKLGKTLSDERVLVRKLKLDAPGLCAVVPPRDVVACEDITIECCGDYRALTRCLDRMAGLDVPVRFKRIAWRRERGQLMLTARVEVPFVAGAALRAALVGEAELEETNES